MIVGISKAQIIIVVINAFVKVKTILILPNITERFIYYLILLNIRW